jgi:tetratricopeptide (TPR) repeat protein
MKRLVCILFIPLVFYGCAPSATKPFKKRARVEEPVPEPSAKPSIDETKPEDREAALKYFHQGLKKMDKNPEEAVMNFSLALLSMPNFPEASYNLGLVLYRTGATENAKEQFLRSLNAGRQLPQAYDALGTLFAKEGQFGEAQRAYGYATALGGSPGTKTNLANLYRLKDAEGASLKHYAKLEKAHPDDPYLNYNIGTLLLHKGDIRGALDRLRRSLVLKDSHPEVLLTLAKAHLMNEEVDEAIGIYEDMSKAYPHMAGPHRNLGIVYELYRLDYEKALEHYQRYVEMDGVKAEEVKVWIEIVSAKVGRMK